MEIKRTTYGGTKTILYNVIGMESHPITVSDMGVDPDANGRKIVPAGTLIGGIGGSSMVDKSLYVTKHNDADCEGILLDDVDVTAGPKKGAIVYKGNIKLGNIPEPPTPAAAAKVPQLRFLA